MAGTNAVSRMPADDFYAQYCDGKAHQDDCSDAIAELCGDKDPCEVSKSDPKLKGFIEAEPVESEPVEAEEGADAQKQLMALLNGGAQAEEASEQEESQPVKKAAPVAGGVSCPESQELKDGKCMDKVDSSDNYGWKPWSGLGVRLSLGLGDPINVDTISIDGEKIGAVTKSIVTPGFMFEYAYPIGINRNTSIGLGAAAGYDFTLTERPDGVEGFGDPSVLNRVRLGGVANVRWMNDSRNFGITFGVNILFNYAWAKDFHMGGANFMSSVDQIFGTVAPHLELCTKGFCVGGELEVNLGRQYKKIDGVEVDKNLNGANNDGVGLGGSVYIKVRPAEWFE